MKGPGRIHHSRDLTSTNHPPIPPTTMSGNLTNPITPRLLETLRSQPGMPADMWYAVVATTLCVLNRPEEIQAVYRHAVAAADHPGAGTAGAVADHARQLRIARRLREALLKTSAIGGLPKVSKQAKQGKGESKPLREGKPRRPRLAGRHPPILLLPFP